MKKLLSFLLVSVSICCAQTITPSSATLSDGQAQAFVASAPVSWSLATGSAGTLLVTDSQHATYTAPAAIHYSATMGGCPVAANDSIFTTRIDSLPVNANNANWTNSAYVGTNTVVFDTAWGISVGNNSTPLKNELFYYTGAYNATPWLIPPVPALKRENGSYVSDQNGSDHHIVAVNTDTCKFYEVYNDYVNGPRVSGGSTYTATSGYAYTGTAYPLATSGTTDAAGLPLGPLTLHLDELQNGAIKHALRFTLAGGYIYANSNATPTWPATEPHFGNASPNSPPYGARYRLKASYNIATFPAYAQTILLGLQQYGMFLADAGTGPTVTVSSDLSRNSTAMAALGAISNAHIPLSQFEVVDESSLMVSAGSAQVKTGTASGQYAALLASGVTVPITLQGIAVAVPDPTIYIAAGTYTYQLPSSVIGSNNKNVTWTLTSGPGAVTSGGLYSPPAAATIATATAAMLQVASQADPTATQIVKLVVLPVNATTGTLRLDSGSTNSFTDKGGYVWQANAGFEAGDYVQLGGDYPNWPAQTNPEIGVYQSMSYTFGSDIEYRLIVPNATYKLRYMFGQAYNGGSPTTCVMGTAQLTPANLEVQGVIAAANYIFGALINDACATPQDFTTTATVTNNQLMVAVRPVTSDAWRGTATATLNGLEIIPQAPVAPAPAAPPTAVTTPIANVPGAVKPTNSTCGTACN